MGREAPRLSSSLPVAKPLTKGVPMVVDPFFGSIVAGGASLLGSWFGAEQSAENTAANIHAQTMMNERTLGFNADQARENRSFQADQASTNRQFQADMSNSAYTRAMADMRNAGLNPILAAKQGGASTPSGAMASGAQASASSPNMALHNTRSAWEGLGEAVNKMVNTAISAKTFEKMTEEIANVQADTAKTKAVEALHKQQTLTEFQETGRRQAEKGVSEYKLMTGALSADEARAILDLPTWLRHMLVQGGYAGGKVEGTLGGASALKHLLPKRSTRETTTTDTHGHGRSTFEERFGF